MLDLILGFIIAIWVTWLLLRLIARFDDEIEPDNKMFSVTSYLIDMGMVAIISVWLVFRFRA